MKISLNSILDLNSRHKTAGNVAPNGVDDLVVKIGAQIGEIEEVVGYGSKFAGVIVVKVVECVKHPDADKLSLCRVDDGGAAKDVERGEDGLVQVVCGAPNVHADMLAAWLPPGSTVPDSLDTEPFVLEARELRGKVSNGMLASPKELGLGESHDGILEIDQDIKPGTPFDEAMNLKGDVIIDIENKMFTHRPDCFGFLGVAREIAGIQGIPFKSPEWYTTNPEFPQPTSELELFVINELPKTVSRFTAIAMSNVKVGPSPTWLVIELAKLGQKSINNIVDYTNYFMLESGQPLHAYDYDKVKALSSGPVTLVVRNPHKDEKIKLLNGKEITPRSEAIMIATDKQAIGVGGIMGGSETEVDNNTTNIIIEAANFDMYSIRRTSMAHGLFTDASTRFTKGQSPLQNLAVQSRIVKEIMQYAGGQVASPINDDNHLAEEAIKRNSLHPSIAISPEFINLRLGLSLSAEEVAKLLSNVEFDVQISSGELTITAPFWRTDIELREDIVEEVGRLYGYDHLPLVLPKRDLTPTVVDPMLSAKAKIRHLLSKAGANEVLTYSFVHGNLLEKVGQDANDAFQIGNALSPDLQYYRMSLVPSLLDKVHMNIKAGYDEFALFEIGKTHSLQHPSDDEGIPKEYEFTALVIASADKLKRSASAYYQAKKYLETLAGVELTYGPLTEQMQAYAVARPYNPDRSALVSIKGGPFLGIIGEFKQSVTRGLKLPKYCAGFEVDTEELQKILSRGPNYNAMSKFPSVTQDITLKVVSDLSYEELSDLISKSASDNLPEDASSTLSVLDIFQKEDDQDHKQVSFRISITADNRTLTDKDVAKTLDAVAEQAKTKFSAERI